MCFAVNLLPEHDDNEEIVKLLRTNDAPIQMMASVVLFFLFFF